MSAHTPNDLHEIFPNDTETLHQLKLTNAHFVTLSERFHDLNRTIHRVEVAIEPASDWRAEQLKKQRLALLDDIAWLIDTSSASSAVA